MNSKTIYLLPAALFVVAAWMWASDQDYKEAQSQAALCQEMVAGGYWPEEVCK